MGDPPLAADRVRLKDLSRRELRAWLAERFGEPAYRGDQLFGWIYRQRARDFAAMTNLPAALRSRLMTAATLAEPELVAAPSSADGTRKLLLRLEDGAAIETVLIPERRRLTLCLSTQVGCALACRFCATGALGFRRNLRPGEIVDQVLVADRLAREQGALPPPVGPRTAITHLVLMGMGEPLMNAEATARAIEVLADPLGLALPPRRVTLSTVGLSHRLWSFLERTGVRLAVSLHAADPALRAELMPIERAHPLRALLAEIRRRQGGGQLRERVTFEYVLLAGVNDSVEHARALAELVRGIDCKVNLLAFNPYAGAAFARPADAVVEGFRSALLQAGVPAYVRRSRGRDIAAACGQLALRRDEQHPVVPLARSRPVSLPAGEDR
ncbi:MAG: dual-specificity RNA methyltransferase RlmN [Planctomycetota bacterium]|nr:MAG: dual-specificity RNA methyltransferase RlmN [Planctomycetota bacterium]